MAKIEGNPSWERPSSSFHAHFDCFSGAAGDMMLAAVLDAAGNPSLMPYIQFCIEEGLPELKGEFSIERRRVWRSETGLIAANYVTVKSKYNHAPAPVPNSAEIGNGRSHIHGHEHGESSTTQQHLPNEHEHEHTHEHTHNHGHSHNQEGDCPAEAEKHTDEDGTIQRREKGASDAELGKVERHARGHSHEHGHSHTHEDTQQHDHDQDHVHKASHAHSHDHATGPLRNVTQIRAMLESAPEKYIPLWVKTTAISAFSKLAEAEALTHGADSIDDVHFHEVGAVDSIVDTVGTVLALHCLGVDSVSCSRLPLGEGTVWTAHGLLPVPAPATLRLLVGMPSCPGPPGITGELVTPTAAALLKVLATSSGRVVGRPPCFTIRKVGIGAGTKDFVKHPNVLRVMIGDSISFQNTKEKALSNV